MIENSTTIPSSTQLDAAAHSAVPPEATLAKTRSRARRKDLDCAKGLAILLVVFGHIVAREPPPDTDWYVVLKRAVYLFHMPFFMYLSGYVTFLSGAARTGLDAWPNLVAKRAQRLLVPFLLFGLVIVFGKLLAARFVYVDNLPSSFGDAMLGLFWNTAQSPAMSVWYIGVLFVFCVITPPLLKVNGGRTHLLFALAVILYFTPMPAVLYLNGIATYLLFFVVGGIAADQGERWLAWMDRYRWVLLTIFAVTLVIVYSAPLPRTTKLLICGVVSMPALHALARVSVIRESRLLLKVGVLSFVIYLLNTPFIGLTKGIMMLSLPWDGSNFPLFAAVLMIVGTLGPVLVKTLLLKRVPMLDKMTD